MVRRSHPGCCHPDVRRPGRDQTRCGFAERGCNCSSPVKGDGPERTAPLPALLSPALLSLLLRTALLLSAVSVLRADPIHLRFRFWAVVVVAAIVRRPAQPASSLVYG